MQGCGVRPTAFACCPGHAQNQLSDGHSSAPLSGSYVGYMGSLTHSGVPGLYVKSLHHSPTGF